MLVCNQRSKIFWTVLKWVCVSHVSCGFLYRNHCCACCNPRVQAVVARGALQRIMYVDVCMHASRAAAISWDFSFHAGACFPLSALFLVPQGVEVLSL